LEAPFLAQQKTAVCTVLHWRSGPSAASVPARCPDVAIEAAMVAGSRT
jgi:hypothetical protein